MTDSILELRSVTYRYPDCEDNALSDLDLTIRRGARLAIVGANGAGKSTLLLHLNGTLRPHAGSLTLYGAPADYSRKGLLHWRSSVGVVFQDPDDQLFAATVEQDVSFGPLNQGLRGTAVQHRVLQALDAMGISELARRAPHALSFGQKRRVAIAGVLAMQPDVLVLDEPTAGLDSQGTEDILQALGRLHGLDKTVVVATHDLDFALSFASEVAILLGGRVMTQGDAASVLWDSATMARAGLRAPQVVQVAQCLEAVGLGRAEMRGVRSAQDLNALLRRGTAVRVIS